MADWVKDHIVDAFSFELNMVETPAVRERFLNEIVANVADELARRVGRNIGIKAARRNPKGITPEASAPVPKAQGRKSVTASAALSMDKPAPGIKGKKVAILVADGVDGKQVTALQAQLAAEGALDEVIARFPGTVKTGDGGKELAVDRPEPNAASVLFDAVFIPGGARSAATLAQSAAAVQFVAEAFMHGKAVGAIGEGIDVLNKARIDLPADAGRVTADQGVVTAPAARDSAAFGKAFIQAMTKRHYERETEKLPA
jgi:catalase